MTSDLVRQLSGEPLREFTGVSAMGSTDGPAPGLVRPLATTGRLARLKRRRDPEGRERYRLREEREPLIPDGARELDISSGTPTDDEIDGSGIPGADEGDAGPVATTDDELLRPSLALVAPDCTPDGMKPLSGKDLPTGHSATPLTAPPGPAAPATAAPAPAHAPVSTTEAAANGVLGMFLSGRVARQATEAAAARAAAPGMPAPGPLNESAPHMPMAPMPMAMPGMSMVSGMGANIHAPQPPPIPATPGATAHAFCSRVRFD